MNEETKNELMQVLLGIAKSGERAASDVYAVLSEQSPQLVEEILTWGLYTDLLGGAVAGVLCVGGVALAYLLFWMKEMEFPAAFMSIFALVFAIDAFREFSSAIMSVVAPRLYVLDYLKDFLS